MNKTKKKQLERFVRNTNIIKYTIGLFPLSFYTIGFLGKLTREIFNLYTNVSIYPERIKEGIDRINQLKKGLGLLWAPNKLEV